MSTTITSGVERLTKAAAQRLLDSQVVNRPISRVSVSLYRNEMNAGRWMLNGEAIKVDRDGCLRDGQHRLQAFIDSELEEMDFFVVRGLEPDSQRTMDQGRKRGADQQLAMLGVKNASVVAAGARLFLTYDNDYLFRDSNVVRENITTPLIQDWVSEEAETVETLSEYMTDIRSSDAMDSVAYCAAVIFESLDPAASRAFFRALNRGAGGEGHPINSLDKRLQRDRRESRVPAPRDQLAFFIHTWNLWGLGTPIMRLQKPRGGAWTVDTFPVPVKPAHSLEDLTDQGWWADRCR